jgi:hypothetical protein
MSHSAIVLLPLAPAPIANCRYLDRCNRALTFDGCTSCRFNFVSFSAEGCLIDSGSQFDLVAISLSEAAR